MEVPPTRQLVITSITATLFQKVCKRLSTLAGNLIQYFTLQVLQSSLTLGARLSYDIVWSSDGSEMD